MNILDSEPNSGSGRAIELIADLRANPKGFFEQGKANQLLQEYFQGFPISTLRSLLSDTNPWIRRAGVWVASELGSRSKSLVRQVAPLIRDPDRYIRYHALEMVAVNAGDGNAAEFVHVINAMCAFDEVIRVRAMRLIANASPQQIDAAIELGDSLECSSTLHKECLSRLSTGSIVDRAQILRMLNSDDALVRKYGAILALRLGREDTHLVAAALNSADSDVSEFTKEMLESEEF